MRRRVRRGKSFPAECSYSIVGLSRTLAISSTSRRSGIGGANHGLRHRYMATGYDYLLSLLEVQKLAYFLQQAGENLRLDFAKGPYGPYADKLRHVLNNIEGHYILGIGDANNKPQTPIALAEGSA